MSKLIFVPAWLSDDLSERGQSLETLKDWFNSAIVSNIDVINYHKAQWQFFKLLAGKEYSDDCMYSMYQNVFMHQLPDMPEIELFLKQDDSKAIIWDDMAAGSGTQDRLRFRIKPGLDGTVIYIIGENVDQGHPCETVCAEPYAIVCSILKEQHNGVRIEGRGLDKSAVFRESPFLAQLYVNLNKSFC